MSKTLQSLENVDSSYIKKFKKDLEKGMQKQTQNFKKYKEMICK